MIITKHGTRPEEMITDCECPDCRCEFLASMTDFKETSGNVLIVNCPETWCDARIEHDLKPAFRPRSAD